MHCRNNKYSFLTAAAGIMRPICHVVFGGKDLYLWVELLNGVGDLRDRCIQQPLVGDEVKLCESPEHVGDILRVELRQFHSSLLCQCADQRTLGSVFQLCKCPQHICHVLWVESGPLLHSFLGKTLQELVDREEVQGGKSPDYVGKLLGSAGLKLIIC